MLKYTKTGVSLLLGLILSSCAGGLSSIKEDTNPNNEQEVITNPSSLDKLQVGLYIDYNQGNAPSLYGRFFDSSVSAYQVLESTNLDFVSVEFSKDLGFAVCGINGIGSSDSRQCFGDLADPYWALFYKAKNDQDWTYSLEYGFSTYQVKDGDQLAFIWTANDNASPFLPRIYPNTDLALVDYFNN